MNKTKDFGHGPSSGFMYFFNRIESIALRITNETIKRVCCSRQNMLQNL